MKQNIKLFYIITILLIILFSSYYVQQKIAYFKHQDYISEVDNIKKYLKNIIYTKQKATMATSISLSDSILKKDNNYSYHFEALQKKLFKLSQKLRKYTEYKNIWIQIIDKNGKSLVRSWTLEHNDLLTNLRKDIKFELRD